MIMYSLKSISDAIHSTSSAVSITTSFTSVIRYIAARRLFKLNLSNPLSSNVIPRLGTFEKRTLYFACGSSGSLSFLGIRRLFLTGHSKRSNCMIFWKFFVYGTGFILINYLNRMQSTINIYQC